MTKVNFLDLETYISAGGCQKAYSLSYSNHGRFYNAQVAGTLVNQQLAGVHQWLEDIIRPDLNNKSIFYTCNLTEVGLPLLADLLRIDPELKWLSIDYSIYFIRLIYKSKTVELRCLEKTLGLSVYDLYKVYGGSPWLVTPYEITEDCLGVVRVCLVDSGYTHFEASIPLFAKQRTFEVLHLIAQGYWDTSAKLLPMGINLLKSVYSISSIAFTYFNTHCNEYKVDKHIKGYAQDFIRPAYFGGRCEVFGNLSAGETALYYDFPGMYAYCMRQLLPVGDYTLQTANEFSKPGYYTITYYSNMLIPVLPNKSDKLYFKNGVNSGTFWFEEILLFIEYGGEVIEIHSALLFSEYKPVLCTFVDNIERLKSAGGLYRRVGKGLINSLYGRFALRDIRSRDYIYTEPGNLSDFVELSPGCYVGKKTAYSELSMNIAIAAAISAKARIRLFRAMQAVHGAGGRVLYCDTDSIVAAYTKSPLGAHVGELYYDADNPNTVITDAVFASPKTYAIKYPTMDIIRVKGVKVTGVTYDAFKKAVEDGADLVFKEQVYLSRRGYKLRRGSVDKTIKINNYNKRRFISKTTTEPLNYDDQG